MMNKNTIVGVVGAGTMGAGIAQVSAQSGHETYLTDASQVVLNKARETHLKTKSALVDKGKLSAEEASLLFSRIHYVENLEDLKGTELVIEAIIENIVIKQKLFSDLETIVSKTCILASNTSSLSIASVGSACLNRGRILGIHFFNPAPLMPLVEIIPALTTDINQLNKARTLIDSWGKTTVVAKDTPGFIVNRIARPFYGESIRIFEEGIADMATIDWAMKEAGGFRMGPFELMDFIGNDINYKVTETVWEQLFYDTRYKPSLTQKRLYEAKLFGRKTGQGYYDYSPGASMPEPVKDMTLAKSVLRRILAMLINEATEALYLKIASPGDIELAMTKGVNYPKGLLAWANETGLEEILATLENLQSTYMEDRYRPSVLLKKLVKEGHKFPLQ